MPDKVGVLSRIVNLMKVPQTSARKFIELLGKNKRREEIKIIHERFDEIKLQIEKLSRQNQNCIDAIYKNKSENVSTLKEIQSILSDTHQQSVEFLTDIKRIGLDSRLTADIVLADIKEISIDSRVTQINGISELKEIALDSRVSEGAVLSELRQIVLGSRISAEELLLDLKEIALDSRVSEGAALSELRQIVLDSRISAEELLSDLKETALDSRTMQINGVAELKEICLDTRKILIQSQEICLDRIEAKLTPILLDNFTSIRGLIKPDRDEFTFNPSVVEINGDYIFSSRISTLVNVLDGIYYYKYRPHNTINLLHYFDAALDSQACVQLDDALIRIHCSAATNGIEDIRLFYWQGSVWGLGAGVRHVTDAQGDAYFVTQILFKLEGNSVVDFAELSIPGGPIMEKNWMPIVVEDELFFIYQIKPFIVYKYIDKKLVLVHEMYLDKRKFDIRGGTQFIEVAGKHIGIAHLKPIIIDQKVFNRHVFVMLDKNLSLEDISEPFSIQRRGAEFACGLAKHADGLLLSYGVGDRSAAYCVIPIHELSRWLVL